MALQDDLCGKRVNMRFRAFGVMSGRTRALFRFDGTQALLGKVHWQTETTPQLVAKTATTRRHRVLGAVECDRQSHDKKDGVPLGDERSNDTETLCIAFATQGGKWMRMRQWPLPYCDADAFFAKVERQNRAVAKSV